MPLPTDAPIHLMGHSRPGETSQSRPKQAMIIRMTDKTLDLLESLPQLQFDFSENPGLTIGETFFPVTALQETQPHDLYLRTSSAAKRNAPLKLYANVTGKFTVERRATIFVDTPTDLPVPSGKRKKEAGKTGMFRKPVRPSDQLRPQPATTAVASSGGASPLPPQPQPQRSKEVLQGIRTRMIRCLAASERTSDQVVKLVGGNDCSASMRKDILDLLEEIAEPVPVPNNSKDPKNYRLKTKSWLDVRPWEINGLSESQRTTMARAARLAFRDLRLPEDHPAWEHVRARNLGGTNDPSKRVGITSTSAKKSNKPKENGEIGYKNEALKASSSRPSTSSSTRDDDAGTSLPPKPSAAAARRGPGSGFRAKQPTPTESLDYKSGRSPVINGKPVFGERPTPTPTQDTRPTQASSSSQSDKRVNGVSAQKTDRLRRDDVAVSDSERSERDREREKARALKGKEREREERERDKRDRLAERERERERDRDRDRERERRDNDKQRERERMKRRDAEFESDRDRDRPRKKARERERFEGREEGERSDDSRAPKRKKISRDDDDEYEISSRMPTKKRKVSPPPRNPPAHPSLPKKPDHLPAKVKLMKRESSPLSSHLPKIPKETSPLPKIKKELAPLSKVSAPPAQASSSTSSSHASSSKPKTGTKRRRGSDIYTSSEDEGEIRPKREPAPTPIPPSNNNHRGETSSTSRSGNTSRNPSGSQDHATLRANYDSSYLPYLGNFQVLMKHKTKLCKLLKKMDKGNSGSVTESDNDGELLDPEDLKKLALEYNSQHEELEKIRRVFSRRD